MNRSKLALTLAGIFGILAVILGAFGAHGLDEYLTENNRLDTYETAVTYQFYHTLALFGLGIYLNHKTNNYLYRAIWCFTGGIIIFSGSLYVLCLTNIGILGAITPIGGVLFILGWTFLLFGSRK